MKKPLVGIVGNILIMEGGSFPGMYRSYVNHDYVAAVQAAGGVPVILPVIAGEEEIRHQIEGVDGIILSGGYDIDPQIYGEEPSRGMGFSMKPVDQYYMQAIRCAWEENKPILGICKGSQAINVTFGGTLYQDLNEMSQSIKHQQTAPRELPTHHVHLEEGTRLQRLLGDGVMVNSFHHQAVKQIAEDFCVAGCSIDGVIEAIEKKDGSYTVGIQWHPEMMVSSGDRTMLPIFEDFVEECGKLRRSR